MNITRSFKLGPCRAEHPEEIYIEAIFGKDDDFSLTVHPDPAADLAALDRNVRKIVDILNAHWGQS